LSAPRVSILIPTRNGGETLREALDAIATQEAGLPFEIVAADSGSTDGTLDLLRARARTVLEIPPASFDHGETRNRGIEACRGEWVVLLVQDAVPASRRWLSELVRPLEQDPRVAGSFARQLPRPDASALSRAMLARWVAAGETARIQEPLSAGELEALSPTERHERCAFDNVSSCLRRAVWERIPFRAAPIAEDLAWGREALLAGHRLAYAPGAAVVHSHERPLRYELGRTYLVHRRLGELFGLRTVPTPAHLLRAVVFSLAAHGRCLYRAHGPWVPPPQLARAVGLALVWPLGQYLGGRAFATGRDLLRPRGI
jgi:rhamnosyltransferase